MSVVSVNTHRYRMKYASLVLLVKSAKWRRTLSDWSAENRNFKLLNGQDIHKIRKFRAQTTAQRRDLAKRRNVHKSRDYMAWHGMALYTFICILKRNVSFYCSSVFTWGFSIRCYRDRAIVWRDFSVGRKSPQYLFQHTNRTHRNQWMNEMKKREGLSIEQTVMWCKCEQRTPTVVWIYRARPNSNAFPNERWFLPHTQHFAHKTHE